ncbi:putative leader peptide [Streptomyces sp. NPDC059900]|uniref:putative leader peptide n=1 Tax=Streptomyces sp. NPDC059900 TaxID=3155816 RepID=UPI0034148E18
MRTRRTRSGLRKRETARPLARRAERVEVGDVSVMLPVLPAAPASASVSAAPRVKVIAPRPQVHLYSRPHIDLQRVAGALCRS